MDAVDAGRTASPAAWVIPPGQHDPVAADKLVELLLRHGIRVFAADDPVTVGYATYPAGSYVIPADQPYREFLITMLRPQRYPEIVPYAGGPIYPPYDVTSWSLPISMGVDVIELDQAYEGALLRIDVPTEFTQQIADSPAGYLLSHTADSVYNAMNRLLGDGKNVYWLPSPGEAGNPGDVYLPAGEIDAGELSTLAAELRQPVQGLDAAPSGPALRVSPTRVGLFKPWVASMDEGWTRFLLEQYEFPYLNLNNDDIKESSFAGKIDVLLFPDVADAIIRTGEPDDPRWRQFWTPLPPKYSGGLGTEGDEAIKIWVEEGGTVVALDGSTKYLIDLFELPVTNVLEGLDGESFSAPGTMLRIELDTNHPLSYGLRPEEAAYFSGSSAYLTSIPNARFGRKVVARFPDHREDLLISGYIKGADQLERRAAVVVEPVPAERLLPGDVEGTDPVEDLRSGGAGRVPAVGKPGLLGHCRKFSRNV